jgi:D-alanyl-D-alanine carboxypeptidase
VTIKPLAARLAVVVGALVVASSAPAAAERGPITDPAGVKAQLDLLTSADRVPGALAEVRDRHGRSVTVTSGTAELGTGRPMVDGDARFRIASVTKPFTAVAVLQLVARYRVRLDAPIETYLPGVVRGTGEGSEIDGRDITVRQLLQHTSGLPDYTRSLNSAELTQPVEPAELVRIALSRKPDFTPGEGWQYSNTGYVLAGMIVERVTRKDIGTAVTELVIRPAHLRTRTGRRPASGGSAASTPATTPWTRPIRPDHWSTSPSSSRPGRARPVRWCQPRRISTSSG